MNRERAKELLPVFKAFAEGKDIEFMDFFSGEWMTAQVPFWSNKTDYRIKPEQREFYLTLDQYERVVAIDGAFIDKVKGCALTQIKVREVIE